MPLTTHDVNDKSFDTDNFEIKRDQSPLVKIVSIILAVALTAGLLIGYFIWRKRHAEQLAAEQQTESKPVRPALPAKVQIYMDEAVRKGNQAVISGTVQNISGERLVNLTFDVELTHRKDMSTETRSVEIEPKELGPDEKGKYALTLTGDYRSIKPLRVTSGPQPEEIGFKTALGAKRPAEYPHETKTVIINKPSTPKQGEEFINTPDNPSKVP